MSRSKAYERGPVENSESESEEEVCHSTHRLKSMSRPQAYQRGSVETSESESESEEEVGQSQASHSPRSSEDEDGGSGGNDGHNEERDMVHTSRHSEFDDASGHGESVEASYDFTDAVVGHRHKRRGI
jgi:hypothetical protein